MSEFEKELENNMKLRKIAYERESIDSDYFVSKWDIERIFHDWQPPKRIVVVPQIVADFIEVRKKELKLHGAFREIEECYGAELYDWVFKKSNGQDLFARAWIDGYTVEKEKKFSLVNKITGEYLVLPAIEYRIKNENIFDHSAHCKNDYLPEWKPEMYQFTEVEIASMETGSYEQIPVEMSDNGI